VLLASVISLQRRRIACLEQQNLELPALVTVDADRAIAVTLVILDSKKIRRLQSPLQE
jgi:hypothetical protein